MILNVGCGGRPNDRASNLGDVRIDIEKFAPVNMVMSAEHLGFRQQVFDKVVCFECLEHLNRPLLALKEVERVLKEDGRFLVSIPNVYYWRSILFKLLQPRAYAESNRGHKSSWSLSEFRCVADGLNVVAASWMDWYPKGKVKTRFLEPLLHLVPMLNCMHLVCVLCHNEFVGKS